MEAQISSRFVSIIDFSTGRKTHSLPCVFMNSDVTNTISFFHAFFFFLLHTIRLIYSSPHSLAQHTEYNHRQNISSELTHCILYIKSHSVHVTNVYNLNEDTRLNREICCFVYFLLINTHTTQVCQSVHTLHPLHKHLNKHCLCRHRPLSRSLTACVEMLQNSKSCRSSSFNLFIGC